MHEWFLILQRAGIALMCCGYWLHAGQEKLVFQEGVCRHICLPGYEGMSPFLFLLSCGWLKSRGKGEVFSPAGERIQPYLLHVQAWIGGARLGLNLGFQCKPGSSVPAVNRG